MRKDSITASEILPLFPTFVWKTQLLPDISQSLNNRIREVLKPLTPDLEHGEAWQSQHELHKLEAFGTAIATYNAPVIFLTRRK